MRHQIRSIWLSDMHLGSLDVNSSFLLDFLKKHDSEYLYLVGDILDLWKLGRGWHWPAINSEIIRLIMEKANNGTKVVYIPGNHDEQIKAYADTVFNGIRIVENARHTTADGRRFLVTHGDEFDLISQHSRWLARIGSTAYDKLLRVNHYFNRARKRCGCRYWSLSAYLKFRVKETVNFISRFEHRVVQVANQHNVDGLICGHIHSAGLKSFSGLTYSNAGDWVESCTALMEERNGRLKIVRWTDEYKVLFTEKTESQAMPAYAPCLDNRRVVTTG
ncbi:MAG: UDP-2,3-diacylglucosamine diphosphatase [Thermodesulfobacteriota bacterium]